MMLELVASEPEEEVEAWAESAVPAEHSLRGFHSVSAALEGYERTAKLLTEVFDYKLVQERGNRFRFCPPDATGPGRMIDLLCMPDCPATVIFPHSATVIIPLIVASDRSLFFCCC